MTGIRSITYAISSTLALLSAGACSSTSNSITQASTGGSGNGGGAGNDDGGGLMAFSAPTDPGPGGILFAASGEVLALDGYDFPPASADAATFVDGWQVNHSVGTPAYFVRRTNPGAGSGLGLQ